ncbi:MAG: (d)CMP kinase [Acidocella sp.]|nr:(d)CMP kinase [Acidocella sp.]
MIIAIDGPAAAGKGTLARRIAATLNLPYLDTGILYRATAKRVLDSGASPADTDAALTAAKSLGQTDLNRSDLRDPATSLAASQVAAIPAVRQALLEFQRNFGTTHGAVLDGRDIGTVIFPGAEVKLFVTASVPARAQRRHTELRSRGEDVSLEDVTADLQARDEADSKRATAPLVPAPDATIFDTTEMDIETAFIRALELIRGKTT